ncbi:MAG: hypothetical protein Q9184_000990 [Pyrenodesmia sp. 2 TL-2023]
MLQVFDDVVKIGIPGKRFSKRPLSEILMEAMFLTQLVRGVNPDRGTIERLLYNGGVLSTGSTLVKWGTELGALRIEQYGTKTLHMWYRGERNARPGAEQQQLLNFVVGRYRKAYDDKLRQLCGHSELEYSLLPPASQEKKRVKEIFQDCKRRAITGLDGRVLGEEANKIIDYYREHAVGLAYSGQTFAIQARCHACGVIYPFAWPQGASHVKLGSEEWKKVAELDPGRRSAPCGCCGEALSYVGGMWVIGKGVELLKVYRAK